MTMGNKIEELTKNVRLVDDLTTSGKEMRMENYIHPNISHGLTQVFRRLFQKDKLAMNWHAWETLSEMDIERAIYLLNIDDMLEEELNKMSV